MIGGTHSLEPYACVCVCVSVCVCVCVCVSVWFAYIYGFAVLELATKEHIASR